MLKLPRFKVAAVQASPVFLDPGVTSRRPAGLRQSARKKLTWNNGPESWSSLLAASE
jgi:hypothetical protein